MANYKHAANWYTLEECECPAMLVLEITGSY